MAKSHARLPKAPRHGNPKTRLHRPKLSVIGKSAFAGGGPAGAGGPPMAFSPGPPGGGPAMGPPDMGAGGPPAMGPGGGPPEM